MIRLSRESMEEAFVKYLETVFEHPEIIRASNDESIQRYNWCRSVCFLSACFYLSR